MLAAYGVDVLDPAVSLRRVWVLLERLPPQYRRGGEQWSTEAELLAVLVDHVANLTWVTLKANGAKNAPRPKPVPRPKPLRASARQGRDRSRPPTRKPGDPAPVKHSTWMDAAAQLSAIPGVVIEDG